MHTLPTRCWAQIDLSALAANVNTLKKFAPTTMAVVKANAYGHGVEIVVPQLIELGIQNFAVATVNEATQLRALSGMGHLAIYLMAAVLAEDANLVVDLNLIPFATDTNFVTELSKVATSKGKIAAVHVEVDTGIGRAGIAPDNLLSTIILWQSLPGITVGGICTHFTSADAVDSNDSKDQLQLFQAALANLPTEILAGKAIHASNSPAVLRLPTAHMTLFRPGLLLYGIPPSPALSAAFPFKPVLSLKARVLLVRHLPAGSDISYSRTYRLPNAATIATIGVGYGDGYPRRLSSAGRVLLSDGTFAPIRGRVCMDQLCIEVPDSAKIKPGDTTTLIGTVGENKITVSDIANQIDTTPHEITTCLTGRVQRISS